MWDIVILKVVTLVKKITKAGCSGKCIGRTARNKQYPNLQLRWSNKDRKTNNLLI